tara:strand:+ start:745 stop:1245 length:501 start_codon:yes stop_codon:yes gene_type:complete
MNYLIAIGYEPYTGLSYYAMATAMCLCFIYGFFTEYGFPSFRFKKKESHEEVDVEEVAQLEDWDTICQTAIEQAKMGDHRARDWVVKHMCNSETPTEPVACSSGTSPVANSQDKTVVEDAVSTLHNAGYNKSQARKIVNELIKDRTYDNAEDLIRDVFSQRQPKSV